MDSREIRARYVNIVGSIHVPGEAVNRVRDAVARHESGAAEPLVPQSRLSRMLERISPRHNVGGFSRWAAAAVIAVCAAGLLVFAQMLPWLSGYSFDVAVYAQGVPITNEEGSLVRLNQFYPIQSSAGYVYDAETDVTDFTHVSVSRTYHIDLSVLGLGVRSVTYRSSNPSVLLCPKDLDPQDAQASTELTTSGNAAPQAIQLSYVLSGDVLDRYRSALGDVEQGNGSGSMEVLLAQTDAKVLEGTSIEVSVEFADGSSRTRSYRFELIDSYEQIIQDAVAQHAFGQSGQSGMAHTGYFRLVEE